MPARRAPGGNKKEEQVANPERFSYQLPSTPQPRACRPACRSESEEAFFRQGPVRDLSGCFLKPCDLSCPQLLPATRRKTKKKRRLQETRLLPGGRGAWLFAGSGLLSLLVVKLASNNSCLCWSDTVAHGLMGFRTGRTHRNPLSSGALARRQGRNQ